MNEVEIAEGSVFTYRLPNGTHVLIHQTTSGLESKEVEEVDCDTVPLLFLEDGQMAYNGSEIMQTQLLDSATEATSFVIPSSPLEVENDKTDQDPTETESSGIAVVSPLTTNSPELLDDTNQEKDDKIDNVLEDDSMAIDKLDDFVELVTLYKCRICPFTTPDRQVLIQHFKLQHLQNKREDSLNNAQADTTLAAPAGDSVELPSDVLTPAQPVSEKLIFLCGQCSNGFASIEACKEHMVQDHDMVVLDASGNSKSGESGNKNGAEDLFSSQTDSLSPGDASKPNSVSENESVVEKDQPATRNSTTGKRKVRMPRMLEREYLLAKESGNTNARSDEVKLKCMERCCQYKFNNEESLQIHMSCHNEAANSKGDGKSEGPAGATVSRRELACFVCGQR